MADEREFLITDIPLWLDCPFQREVPEWMNIRRGELLGQLVLGLEAPDSGKHLVIWQSEFPKVASELPLELQCKLALLHAVKYLSRACGQQEGKLQ